MIRNLFGITCVFLYGIFYSQEVSYPFTHLSTNDGLSQSAVIAIEQDQLGQIWIGTRDGLNKYDGTNFSIYRNEISSKSISNNDILSIEEDNEGFLWIGTYNGLNRYNPKKDDFERFFHDEKQASLCDNTIWAIESLSNSSIAFGTSGGLSIYDKRSKRFTNYLNTSLKPISQRVMSILETSKGELFIGTGSGVLRATKKDTKLTFDVIKASDSLYVQDIEEDSNGDIFIATRSRGVFKYNRLENTLDAFLPIGFNDKNWDNIRQLLFDFHNNMWVGTYDGLLIVDNNKNISVHKADIDNNNSLSKNSIKSLFLDKKGSVWVGTYYGGINIWDETNANFSNISQNQKGKGLNYSVVSAIEHYDEKIFFATEGGGINVWDTQQNNYEYITLENSRLFENNIKALTVLKDKLWIGTFKNGVQIYNLKTNTFESSNLPAELQSSLKNTGVYSIKSDRYNSIWIGSFGQGLFEYNLISKTFKQYNTSNKTYTLSSNLVRTVCIDSKNNVWVGTEKGLNKISKDKKSETFFYDSKLQYGDDILCVVEDRDNQIWVGTKSMGLYRYDQKKFNKVELDVNKTIISTIHSIIEDKYGDFWISTNQGIVKYEKDSNKIKIYNQTYGLISNEFNDNSSLKIRESNFYFGGPAGVTYFNSEELTVNNYSPQVILTDFTVKEPQIDSLNSFPILKNKLPYLESINLLHTQGNFNISFAIPNYINSNSNQYKYRLQGLEKNWNITTSNNASYTIQKPGNYVFEVKGANNDGIWNTYPTTLNINVEPAPWRTWWAFSIYGLLILGALYFLLSILKSRTKLKHDLQLEYLEGERTKEDNKKKLEFFTNISHEFRTPLTLILGPLHQIIENYQGNSKVYKKLMVIENNASHLLQLINRLMDFRKFESHLYKLEAAEGNLVKFLREIFLSFVEHAENGNYNFNFFTSKEEILVYYDRNKLERVFYNLISNAFRYTPEGGTINIRLEKLQEEILISVEDTGVGIAEEYQDKIFERFFEVAINNKPDKDYNKGSGIGLSIVKNIVELHKGQISVKTNTNNIGSIFTLSLPLGRSHLKQSEIIKDFKFSDDVSQYTDQIKNTSFLDDLVVPLISEDYKKTILLVEDNKELRKFIKDLLINEHNIVEAENGIVALQKARTENIDLIVSDVIMPEMTGTELCSKIKADLKTSHIPIILLTSRSSLIYKLDGLDRGADDYISKPFNINEFKSRIQNLLKTRERLREKFSSTGNFLPSEVYISSQDENLYKKALKIVNNNIQNEKFDVAYFSSELGVSRTMLFTKIKAWSNFTPNEFILHFRMQRAAQLLEQGKINVSQVAYKVGYNDPKYFSKSFQKKFGMTPSEYNNKFNH